MKGLAFQRRAFVLGKVSGKGEESSIIVENMCENKPTAKFYSTQSQELKGIKTLRFYQYAS